MLSDRLFPTSKKNPCPICGNESGKCRTKDNEEQAVLCAGSGFARKFDREGLYICVNHSGKGHTSHTWVLAKEGFDNWDDARKEAYFKEKVRRAAAAEKARLEAIAREMSALDRNGWGLKVLSELQLLDKYHEQLAKKRNLPTEVIKRIGFRSVKKYQKLSFKCPDNYPGYNPEKQSLICQEGMIAPIRQEGEIVGFENRLDNPGEDEGRYRVVSSQTFTSIHLMGEVPLGVYHSKEVDQQKGIWVIEGKAWKPQIANELFDIPVLAGARYWHNSPNHAAKFLPKFKETYGNKIILTLDAGDIINKDVFTKWIDECKFFQAQGFHVRFAWWGQITKEESDIDELLTLNNIQYLDIDEIIAVSKTNEVKKESLDDWAWKQWVNSRKFTPDIVLNQDEFNFPVIPEHNATIPQHNAIIAVKSGMGTGKTDALIRLIKFCEDVRAMIVGYRNNLLTQTAHRALNDHKVKLYHLKEDDGISLLADIYTHLLFCLDSIGYVDGYFQGTDIYIDEVVSVVLHGLNGGTLGDKQAEILKIFTQALQVCNRIIIMDANLSDLIVDFIAKLAPNKKVIKIENKKKVKPHTFKFVDAVDVDGEIKKRDRSPLIKILLDTDVIPWIFCDSKERSKVIYQLLTSAGKKGYVLNSETVGEDWAKKLLEDPNKWILENKPEFIIVSPTAESGVSVTLKNYFTHKFSFFVGVQGTNSQTQATMRLRDDSIDHYVFCPETSTVKDRSNPHTYNFNKIKEILNERVLQSAFLATQSANNQSRALEVITGALSREDAIWFDMSAKMGALDNYEMDNLRKCLIYALEEQGHKVELIQLESISNIKEAEKEAKEIIQKQEAREINSAIEFDDIEEAKKAKKSNPNKATLRRIEKTFLLDKLPGIKDSQLWGDDFVYECHIKRREFIRGIERYYLVKNFDVSQKRHESQWFYQATKEDFCKARVSRMSHDVIWALRELNILQFTDGREYHKDSNEVVELVENIRTRKDLQIALRIDNLPKTTKSGKERLAIVSQLLGMIGFKNKSQGKKFVGEIRLNHYSAVPVSYKEELADDEFNLDAAREDILKSIDTRFTAWMQSEKAVIDWEEKPEELPVVSSQESPVTNDQLPMTNYQSPITDNQQLNNIISVLKNATDWGQVANIPQALINQAWQHLSEDEDKKLRQLHQNHQNNIHSTQKTFVECAITKAKFELVNFIDDSWVKVKSCLTGEIDDIKRERLIYCT